jgi:hypothetical protein
LNADEPRDFKRRYKSTTLFHTSHATVVIRMNAGAVAPLPPAPASTVDVPDVVVALIE